MKKNLKIFFRKEEPTKHNRVMARLVRKTQETWKIIDTTLIITSRRKINNNNNLVDFWIIYNFLRLSLHLSFTSNEKNHINLSFAQDSTLIHYNVRLFPYSILLLRVSFISKHLKCPLSFETVNFLLIFMSIPDSLISRRF